MKHESGTGQRRQGPRIDFQFWARKAYWHPEEAAALSFPIDPEYLRFCRPMSTTILRSTPNYEIAAI